MNLDELIVSYGKHDGEAKFLKKVCDTEKEQIKSLMTADGVDKSTAGGYTVSLRTSETVSLDEVKMVEVLRAWWSSGHGSQTCPYIQYQPMINSDALEAAIYAGNIPAEVLAEIDSKCKHITKKVALYCKKAKSEASE